MAGLEVDAHPGHPVADIGGQRAEAVAQRRLTLVGQDGHQAAARQAADRDDQVLAPEAVLVDPQGHGSLGPHQGRPVAPGHGQPLERPAGPAVAHAVAPLERRGREFPERRQHVGRRGHAHARPTGHPRQARGEGPPAGGAPEPSAMDQDPQPAAAQERPQDAARSARPRVDPGRDDPAAGTAVLRGDCLDNDPQVTGTIAGSRLTR